MSVFQLFLAAVAGFTGSYLMILAGWWAEGILGLPRVDFGLSGLRFMGGQQQGSWIVGVIFHLVDGILLAFVYAALVYPNLPLIGLSSSSVVVRVGAGVVYGIFIWIVLFSTIAMPLVGAGPFGIKTGSVKPALTGLFLHLVFGFLLGIIYVA